MIYLHYIIVKYTFSSNIICYCVTKRFRSRCFEVVAVEVRRPREGSGGSAAGRDDRPRHTIAALTITRFCQIIGDGPNVVLEVVDPLTWDGCVGYIEGVTVRKSKRGNQNPTVHVTRKARGVPNITFDYSSCCLLLTSINKYLHRDGSRMMWKGEKARELGVVFNTIRSYQHFHHHV